MKVLNKALLIICMLLVYNVNAQIEGCTDPNANNYNPNATINDGSCTYDPTFYNPAVFFDLHALLNETSGLIFFDGYIFTHNDSGNEPEIYKVDTVTGQIIQTIRLNNASNIDWEDIAQDDQYIYVGDIGNNKGNRQNLRIYKINKEEIPEEGNITLSAEIIDYVYEDQNNAYKKSDHNFDCEAMIVCNDSIYLFTKNWLDSKTKLYSIPKPPGSYTAKLKNIYNINGLVTGAAYNPEENEIVLSGYINQLWAPFIFLLFDYNDNDFFSGNKRRIDFPFIISSQTEGISYYDEKHAFISAEQTQTTPQRVYKLNTGIWTDIPSSGIRPVFSEHIQFDVYPNPVKGKSFYIELVKIPDESYKIEIFDSLGHKIFFNNLTYKKKYKRINIKLSSGKLEPGTYVIRISSGTYFATRKLFVKQ